ncbi:MAG: DUF3892 domain-containing protein [Patescibacteria group bacterium]|jgi:hypothetical protein
MADRQITCIIKPNTLSPHEHITHVGNPTLNWLFTREETIRRIEDKIDTFYVLDPASGRRADVGIRRPIGRPPFIQTYSDGDWNNNLLSLSQCPLRR